MNKPLLSICLISYNQERFILDALKGIAFQEVDFDFELIVADDCSTDNTLGLIKEFLAKGTIKNYRLLDRPANLGMQRNWYDALQACEGKYIALLEGDDYWTDWMKLKKQVDFLEDNPAYVGCFHNTEERYEDADGVSSLYCKFTTPLDVDFDMLTSGNLMPTCAIVFKMKTAFPFPQWYFDLNMVDWPLNLLNAQYGKYKYLPKVMGVHRLHQHSVWMLQPLENNHKSILRAYDVMIGGFESKPLLAEKLKQQRTSFLNFINSKPPTFLQRVKRSVYMTIRDFGKQ